MIFFSAHFYALGKTLGTKAAASAIAKQAIDATLAELPAIKTLWRLRSIEDVVAYVDNGCCSIARGRSRVFHLALETMRSQKTETQPVWFACDDDCEATRETLLNAVALARDTNGIVLVPYLLRDGSCGDLGPSHMTSVTIDCAKEELRTTQNGTLYAPCLGGGFGLVAASLSACERFAEEWKDLTWKDEDGVARIAAFAEAIFNETWLGEDLSFFARCPPDVPIWTLLTGQSFHAGHGLNLADVPIGAVEDPEPTIPSAPLDDCADPRTAIPENAR